MNSIEIRVQEVLDLINNTIEDGGNNTALEVRTVLSEITTNFSGATRTSQLTNNGADGINNFVQSNVTTLSGLTITESQISNYFGRNYNNLTNKPNLQVITTAGNSTTSNITANSFIKSGSTANDVLLGDGSTTSLTGITNSFIPLIGTEVGSPVTGAIEFDGYVGNALLFPSGADSNIIHSLFNEDGNLQFSTIDTNTGNVTFFSVGGTLEYLISSDTPLFKGLQGQNYYGPNYDDFTYVQKKYVDDAISGATSGITDTIYTSDGFIPSGDSRTITILNESTLSFYNSNEEGISLYDGIDGVGFSIDVAEFSLAGTNGENSINFANGSGIEIIGSNGLQIRPGSGGTVNDPSIGMVLTAIGEQGETAWAEIPINTLTPKVTADIGSVIPLDSSIGHQCNIDSPNSATTYTLSSEKVTAGFARVLINASTEPLISGATQDGGVQFQPNVDMYLIVFNKGTDVAPNVSYWYYKANTSPSTSIGKYSATFGDDVISGFTINHGLNTEDISITIKNTITGVIEYADIIIIDANNIQINFSVVPTTDEFRVTIIG